MKVKERTIITLRLEYDDDVVLARQRARQIAKLLGFNNLMQVQIATAVSEIARNVIMYAGSGVVEFYIDSDELKDRLMIKISDNGPGIKDVDKVLSGNFKSKSGMGIGIKGSKMLMDHFQIESRPGKGTIVIMGKNLPNGKRISDLNLDHIALKLQKLGSINAYDELKQQNRELIELLDSLTRQKNELEKLNQELLDKNRGIQNLYNELQEKVKQLKGLLELKNKFIYYITHDFKTPVATIIYLTDFLLNGKDGNLNDEQKKQVRYIKDSARNLLNLINEILELAKLERGRLKINLKKFSITELFSSLKGIFETLNKNKDVKLNFNYSPDIPILNSDMDKVNQILENLIINALKFTKKGNITIESKIDRKTSRVLFRVKDTGIGIPEDLQSKIFKDFEQIGTSEFNGIKGTGLGLPFSKKMAKLLGGDLYLEKSEPGKGSTFVFWIPMSFSPGFNKNRINEKSIN